MNFFLIYFYIFYIFYKKKYILSFVSTKTGSIECGYMIKNNLKNKPIELSVQQLLDCTYGNLTDSTGYKYWNGGCYGGRFKRYF